MTKWDKVVTEIQKRSYEICAQPRKAMEDFLPDTTAREVTARQDELAKRFFSENKGDEEAKRRGWTRGFE